MKLALVIVALIGSAIAVPAPETDALARQGLKRLWLDVANNTSGYSKNCTARTVARRREWYDCMRTAKQYLTYCRSTLKRSEKLNYIDAVQCLGKTKARFPSAVAAGAKTRYDDFAVTHILLTQTTHGNVSVRI
jgi:tyrosinase